MLTVEEKDRYAERAKSWKNREPDPPSPIADYRHVERTSVSERTSRIWAQQKEQPRGGSQHQEPSQKQSSELESKVIYIINVFSHGDMPNLCPQPFVPCEIGCVRYSLLTGVMGSFHDFIDPGELPLGFRYHCHAGSAATHQIPVSGFELANKDYHNMFRGLCEFAGPARGLPAEVYCRNNDMYRVKWCLQWLADKAGIRNPFQLQDIESLIIQYYNVKLRDEPSKSSVHRLLDVVHWDYANNTRCKWHEENDMWCCALASCKKVTYCMSKALSSVYGIVLTPGHLPSLQPEDQQQSASAKTIVLNAKRYQKSMDSKFPSDHFNQSTRIEHDMPWLGRQMTTPCMGRGRGILRLLEAVPVSSLPATHPPHHFGASDGQQSF
ncbi:protein maelstrom homolog isoform X2 [Pseudophryne corroboree]